MKKYIVLRFFVSSLSFIYLVEIFSQPQQSNLEQCLANPALPIQAIANFSTQRIESGLVERRALADLHLPGDEPDLEPGDDGYKKTQEGWW